MAYDLFPNITVTSDTGDAVPVATTLAHELHEITGITFNWSGDMLSAWLGVDSAIRWTSHVEDIAKFSALYPDLRISAEFEDMNGDRWIVYALAGETQSEDGKVVFGDCKLWGDPPDVAAWHPILATGFSSAMAGTVTAEAMKDAIAEARADALRITGIDPAAPGSDRTVITIHLDPREHATILAALRWWQRSPVGWIPGSIMEIAMGDEGRLDLMIPSEIDALCERINTTPGGDVHQWSEKQIAEIIVSGPHTAAKINLIGGAK